MRSCSLPQLKPEAAENTQNKQQNKHDLKTASKANAQAERKQS
jgi:hypothetical protein